MKPNDLAIDFRSFCSKMNYPIDDSALLVILRAAIGAEAAAATAAAASDDAIDSRAVITLNCASAYNLSPAKTACRAGTACKVRAIKPLRSC